MNKYCQDVLDTKTSRALQEICKVTLDMPESLSQLIKRRLSELAISKADLAKRAGVSRTYIGDLANATAKTQSGSYRPKPEVLSKLASALEVAEIEILNALGYASDESSKHLNSDEEYEVLDGVRLKFHGSNDWSEEDREKALEAVKTVVAGIKARKSENLGKSKS